MMLLKKKWVRNNEAAIVVNIVFITMNLLGVLPDMLFGANPQDDQTIDAKYYFTYSMFTVKFFMPYLLIVYFWVRSKHGIIYTEVVDWALLFVCLLSCIKDVVDSFSNPESPMGPDFIWVIAIWVFLHTIKFSYLIKHLFDYASSSSKR